jgi:hypothetical protein
MHPQDPYQQQQPQYPPQQYPPQPPPQVYVQQPASKATALGVWAIFLWIAGPVLLIVLCCGACLATGVIGSAVEGFQEGYSSPSP